MGFLHPLLLAGLAAVTVPILIHLLLRQRPRPRPWAAMRWLLAAAQQASRRYRLTNLLLLFLRMLLICLIALAVARPLLGGLGDGERLVLIIDRTASMGAHGTDPGPLAAAQSALQASDLAYRSVVVVSVANDVELVVDGTPAAAVAAIGRLTASDLPGGLDRAAHAPLNDRVLAALGSNRPDVVLISDFQQDQGEALSALLAQRARQVVRWAPLPPAAAGANAAVVGVGAAPDLLPGQGGGLDLLVSGQATAVTLGVDDAPLVEVPTIGLNANPDPNGLRTLTVPLPPLPAGDHLLHVKLSDSGLAYDNLLELPVRVRPAIPTLLIGGTAAANYLDAALRSDDRAVAAHAVNAALIAGEPLASGGLVALHARLPSAADAERLATWVRDGGVLWGSASALLADPALAGLLSGIQLAAPRAGGAWNTGSTADHDLDALLGLGDCARLPTAILPATGEVILRAGEAPAVVAVPAGRGWVVAEIADLAGDSSWQARGSTPLWTLRMARRYTARAGAVPSWTAGDPAPESASLKRGSDVVTAVAGEALAAAPGCWTTAEGRAVVVLPNRDEGRIDRPTTAGNSWRQALARRAGADAGPWLLLAALVAALGEGLVAAWAGRTYGR